MTDRINTEWQRLREASHDRRTQLLGAGAATALFLAWVSVAVATGDMTKVALGLAIVFAPFLLALAYFRPYLFPYGLYIMIQPFENLLGNGRSGSVIKLIGACAMAAVVVLILRRRRLIRPPVTLAIAAVYVLWTLLSSMWAVDMGLAFVDAQTVFTLVALFAVFAVAPIDERDLRAICTAVILSGIAASVYGIWYLLKNPPTDDGRLAIQFVDRALDSNQFADGLLAPIALSLVGLLHARKPHTLLAYAAALAILVEGVIISVSREAIFGCLAIGVVLVLMSRRRMLSLALFVPVVAVIPLLVPAIVSRFLTAVATGGAGRTAIWQVDLHAWLAHPIIGWGAGSAFQAYNAMLLQVAPRMFAGWGRPPHNAPLHALVDLGAVGLALLTACYVLTFRQMRGIKRGDPLYDLRVGLTASLVAIGVVSFFIDNAVDKYVWIIICAVAQLRTVVHLREPAAAQAAVVYEPPRVRSVRALEHVAR